MRTRTALTLSTFVLALGLVAGAPRAAAAADTYQVDRQHAYAVFKVMHLDIVPNFGSFEHVEGTYTLDEANPANTSFSIKVKVDSVDTHVDKRDQHLRSPDFFNAKQFPWMTFESKKVKKTADGYEVTGDLTIKGIAKPITVAVKKTGEGKDPWGNFRTGFYTEFTIKRSDYGITFMPKVVGDEVTIMFALEGIKQ